MIIAYINKEKIPNFDTIDFMVREEPFNKRMVANFLNKKLPEKFKDSNNQISQVEIYITRDAEDVIIYKIYGGNVNYTVLTGSDAKEFAEMMAEELEKRTKNMELLSRKYLTKSTPPQEIKLPNTNEMAKK